MPHAVDSRVSQQAKVKGALILPTTSPSNLYTLDFARLTPTPTHTPTNLPSTLQYNYRLFAYNAYEQIVNSSLGSRIESPSAHFSFLPFFLYFLSFVSFKRSFINIVMNVFIPYLKM
jgi:hypothetical protein